MDWRADIIFERLRPGSMLGVMPEHEPLRAELARRASGTDCRFVSAADLLHEDFAIARSRLAYGLRQVRQVRQYTVESGPLNLYHYDIYDYKLTPLMAQQQRLGTPGAVGKGALVGKFLRGTLNPHTRARFVSACSLQDGLTDRHFRRAVIAWEECRPGASHPAWPFDTTNRSRSCRIDVPARCAAR